ncbi:MAG: DUF2243 domain-containing protein [Pseudomonadota bacterium]
MDQRGLGQHGYEKHTFPAAAGVFLGLGLGGAVDAVLMHQLLQWHHVISSAGHLGNGPPGMRMVLLWDGLYHAATYLFVVAGLTIWWRAARRARLPWSGRPLVGTILFGFGLFNVAEGLISHHILKIHHVNETVPMAQWIYWDLAFLLLSALMLAAGRLLWTAGPGRLWKERRRDQRLHLRYRL